MSLCKRRFLLKTIKFLSHINLWGVINTKHLGSLKLKACPWRLMVGRWNFLWDGLCSWVMLVLGSITSILSPTLSPPNQKTSPNINKWLRFHQHSQCFAWFILVFGLTSLPADAEWPFATECQLDPKCPFTSLGQCTRETRCENGRLKRRVSHDLFWHPKKKQPQVFEDV